MTRKLSPLLIFIFLLTLASLACNAISGGETPAPAVPEVSPTNPSRATPTSKPTEAATPTEESVPEDVLPTAPSAGKPAPLPTVPPPEFVDGEVHQWAVSATASSEYGPWDWSAMQAAGGPNTWTCGDMRSAWTPQSPDTVETLELTYDKPVYPSQINIHQSYNPGQIILVEFLDVFGEYHEVYADDPAQTNTCPEVLTIDLDQAQFNAQLLAVRITVDQSVLGVGVAEIDAVEVVGMSDAAVGMGEQELSGELSRTWATAAEATSQYGSDDWSAMQAVGAPDTQVCGDHPTAWAAADSTETAELTLWYYDTLVVPVAVNIYQSYSPSQVVRVTVTDPSSEYPETVIYEAEPVAVDECPFVLSIPVVDVPFQVMQVSITVDQSALGLGWNEIDAVELVGYAQAGSAPASTADWVSKNLPVYPNAENVDLPDDWTLTFRTQDDRLTVIEFYKQALGEYGWFLDMDENGNCMRGDSCIGQSEGLDYTSPYNIQYIFISDMGSLIEIMLPEEDGYIYAMVGFR